MDEFAGHVAVVTGAASGIGRALAHAFARERMNVVIADVEEAALMETARSMDPTGANVLPVITDVADRDAVFALARAALDRFGKVHVLCNNAGVGGATGGGPGVWNAPPESWDWTLGVNFHGVLHGLQAFTEHMLSHGEPGHIVNTSSVLGVWTGAGTPYSVSKHAVTALTEGLFADLETFDARIGVSLLLPELTATRINTAARNWREASSFIDPDMRHRMEQMESRYMAQGMSPDEVAAKTLDAIRHRRFYVFTHPGAERRVRERMQAIIDGTDPVAPWQSR